MKKFPAERETRSALMNMYKPLTKDQAEAIQWAFDIMVADNGYVPYKTAVYFRDWLFFNTAKHECICTQLHEGINNPDCPVHGNWVEANIPPEDA